MLAAPLRVNDIQKNNILDCILFQVNNYQSLQEWMETTLAQLSTLDVEFVS